MQTGDPRCYDRPGLGFRTVQDRVPNILFLHVDQMHADAVSAYGSRYCTTPAIDRLAADGVSFRRAYAAQPVCCPARASWFTGRTPLEHGVLTNAVPIDPELPDLGQWLRGHSDYETVYAGKWHIPGRNVADSFDYLHPGTGMGEIGDGDVGRAAVAFLRNRTSQRPFFLSVGFLNPHDCCFTCGAGGGVGKFDYAASIESELPPLPENFDPDLPWLTDEQRGRVGHWTERDWRYYIYSCYRQTEMADAHVGLVYDALRRSRFAQNTLVLFAADHGEGMGHHGRILKNFLEEESWRVPTIMVPPGSVSERSQENRLVSSLDIPATICDYAGVRSLPDADVGRSLRSLAAGDPSSWRTYVFGETEHSAAVQDGRWKAIFYPQSPTRMFDLADDPLETRNLAASPAHKAELDRLAESLRGYVRGRAVYSRLGEDAPGVDRSGQTRKERLRKARIWYESIAEGSGLAV